MLIRTVFFILVISFFSTSVPAVTYKQGTQRMVQQVLQQFYREEQGNRLSSFSMRSLAATIDQVFEANKNTKGDGVGGKSRPSGKREGSKKK